MTFLRYNFCYLNFRQNNFQFVFKFKTANADLYFFDYKGSENKYFSPQAKRRTTMR